MVRGQKLFSTLETSLYIRILCKTKKKLHISQSEPQIQNFMTIAQQGAAKYI